MSSGSQLLEKVWYIYKLMVLTDNALKNAYCTTVPRDHSNKHRTHTIPKLKQLNLNSNNYT